MWGPGVRSGGWWGWMLLGAALATRVAAPGGAGAQDRIRVPKRAPQEDFSIEGGSSFGNIHVFAYADGRRINPIGIEYDRHSWGGLLGARVDYVSEILPVVLLNEPAVYGADSRALSAARKTHYGAGISPLGVRLLWRRNSSFKPYLIGKGGLLYFKDHVLSDKATKLNFSAQFGGGVQARLRPGMDLRVGYTDYHFSNGDISARNPGIDFMYINAGLVFRFGGVRSER
jgi:opacity protein-like surface antigen